jgi:thioredoxin reductase (NADPH)
MISISILERLASLLPAFLPTFCRPFCLTFPPPTMPETMPDIAPDSVPAPALEVGVPIAPDFVPDRTASIASTSLAARAHQMFPTLSDVEIARLHRFGVLQQWEDGQTMFVAGRDNPGMVLILAGRARVTQCDGMGREREVTEHGPGEFSGEVAQLAGRPALVNVRAKGPVRALVIAPASLRALVVAEAELGERIMRALILRRVGLIEAGASVPLLIGAPGHPDLFRLQRFLAANGQPHSVLDPADNADAAALVAAHRPAAGELPLVVCPDGSVKKNPSLIEMGRCLGLLPALDGGTVFDVLVVGAGPSGLATAVYAASEGLSVLVLEQQAFGGQAGASARIENYLGFPTGVSGRALSGRAFVQAQKFGAEVAIPARALRLECDQRPLRLTLEDGTTLQARAVVLACGARYRKPALANLATYEGCGVYYWASPIEAKLCRGEEVVLVGGGNSAGQAAVFLASHAAHVHMLIRGPSLAASMSSYLIERIAATDNITLHAGSELTSLDGDGECLNGVTWRARQGGSTSKPIRRVFLFVGADPNTDWLGDCGVEVDEQGFVRTGTSVMLARCRVTGEMLNPDGSLHGHLETTVPGVFAIGDVRAGSTKRVAAAVGEGAAVVAQLHAYL